MATVASFTPGPWWVQEDQSEWDEGRVVQIVSGDAIDRGLRFINPVCQIEVTSWEEDEDGNETIDPSIMADARLIAAAPALFDAANAARVFLDSFFGPAWNESAWSDPNAETVYHKLCASMDAALLPTPDSGRGE